MRTHDPFAVPEPGFEKWDGPLNSNKDLSQPDLTPRTLKDWLRSDECAAELNQQPAKANPAKKTVRFVNTERGVELHIQDGNLLRVLTGPRSELEKIARAHR